MVGLTREGRVEVCLNGAWGAVCAEEFQSNDAEVVCLQLNFSREGVQFNEYSDQCSNLTLMQYTVSDMKPTCLVI